VKAVPKYLARVVGSSAPSAGNALRPPHFLFGPVGLPLADGERALSDAVGSDNSNLNGPNLNGPNLNGPNLDGPGPSLEPRTTWNQKAREMAGENPIASTPWELGPPSFNQAEAPAPWPLSGSPRRRVDRPEADAESLLDCLPGGTHRHTRGPAPSPSPTPTVRAREARPPGSAGVVAANVPAPVIGDGYFAPTTEDDSETAFPPVTARGPAQPSEFGPLSRGPATPPKLTYTQTAVAPATGGERGEPVPLLLETPSGRHSPGDPPEALLPVPGLWSQSQAGPPRAGRPPARPARAAFPSVPRVPSGGPPGPARITIGTIEVHVVPAPPPAPAPFPPIVAPPVRPAPGDHRTVVDVARLGVGRWFGTGQG
jgi:hypothetical protein